MYTYKKKCYYKHCFIEIKPIVQNKNGLFIIINNEICDMNMKYNLILTIYKIFNHLSLLNNFTNIKLIIESKDSNEIRCFKKSELLLELYSIKFKKVKKIDYHKECDIIIPENSYVITNIKLKNINSIKYIKIFEYLNISINNNCPNYFVPFSKQQIINNLNIECDTQFELILNSGKSYEILKNYKKEYEYSENNIKIVNALYNIYFKTNSDDIIKFIPIYEYYFTILSDTNIKMNKVINILKECIYVLKIKNIKECNYLKNFDSEHIQLKYFIKMTKIMNFKTLNKFKNKLYESYTLIEDKIEDYDDCENCEYYYSNYTMSSWKDEIEEKGCMGLLLDIKIPDHCRTGNLIWNIYLINITNTFMSVTDFLNALGNSEKFNGDINNHKIINDSVMGSGNIVLPLYINKIHWEISKCYIPIMLSMLFTNNSISYLEKMDNIYYYVLNDFCNKLFDKKIVLNENLIKNMSSIYRTCIQLSFDKRYHKGFEKHFDKIITINDNFNTFNLTFMQIITSSYFNFDKINNFIKSILQNYINYIIKNKTIEYISTIPKDTLYENLKIMLSNYNIAFLHNKIIINCIVMKMIFNIKSIHKGMKNMINSIDKIGYFDNETILYIIKFINNIKCDTILNNLNNLDFLHTDTIKYLKEDTLTEIFYDQIIKLI